MLDTGATIPFTAHTAILDFAFGMDGIVGTDGTDGTDGINGTIMAQTAMEPMACTTQEMITEQQLLELNLEEEKKIMKVQEHVLKKSVIEMRRATTKITLPARSIELIMEEESILLEERT